MKAIYEIVACNLEENRTHSMSEEEQEEMAWTIYIELSQNNYGITRWLEDFIDHTWYDLRILDLIECEINELLKGATT